MAKRKYIYHHLYKNEEVSKEKFLELLGDCCVDICGNSDNPFMNIGVVNYDKVKKEYDFLKRSGTTVIYDCSGSFRIRKETI